MHTNGTHVDVTDLVRVFEDAQTNPLEYVTLPSGDVALLRQVEPEERFVLTERGRYDLHRALAMDALFGRPWPTVAKV